MFKIFKTDRFQIGILFLTWGIYFILLWPKMLFFDKAGDLVAGFRNVWGDWAMHISQVSSFAYQPFFYVIKHHPLIWGQNLTYPFVINLFSAYLLKLHLPLDWAMNLPMIFFSLIFLIVIYRFYRIFLSANQSLLAISIFFMSGGTGFLEFFKDLADSKNIWRVLSFPPREYTHMKDIGYWWSNTFTAFLVPQRAFILGFICGLILLTIIYYIFRKKFKNINYLQSIILGLGLGSLIYIHSHTLIVLFIVIAYLSVNLILETVIKSNQKSLEIFVKLALIVFGAILAILPFVIFLSGPSFKDYLAFLPGWLANKKELNMNWVLFWLQNWGLIIPLAFLGFFIKMKSIFDKRFLLSWWLVFILANLIRFQPSTWDNAKLLLWVYLGFSISVVLVLDKLWQKIHLRLIVIIIFISLILSGGLDLLRLIKVERHSYRMLDVIEIRSGNFLRKNSLYNQRILTSKTHLNWVPMISGRGVVLGYTGWLWSYGYEYYDIENDIEKIYQARINIKNLLHKYQVKYVVFDDQVLNDYRGANETFFKNNFRQLISSPQLRVYIID